MDAIEADVLRRAEAYLSLLRHRASIPWGSIGLPDAHEVDQVIGQARAILYPQPSTTGMKTHCDVCGGLGAQVEVFPWGLARRVCESGHRWVTAPVPGTEPPIPRTPPA